MKTFKKIYLGLTALVIFLPPLLLAIPKLAEAAGSCGNQPTCLDKTYWDSASYTLQSHSTINVSNGPIRVQFQNAVGNIYDAGTGTSVPQGLCGNASENTITLNSPDFSKSTLSGTLKVLYLVTTSDANGNSQTTCSGSYTKQLTNITNLTVNGNGVCVYAACSNSDITSSFNTFKLSSDSSIITGTFNGKGVPFTDGRPSDANHTYSAPIGSFCSGGGGLGSVTINDSDFQKILSAKENSVPGMLDVDWYNASNKSCNNYSPGNTAPINIDTSAYLASISPGARCSPPGATQGNLICGGTNNSACTSQGCTWAAATSGATGTSASCESNDSAGAFSWILCPAFDLMDSVTGVFYNFVEGQLCFDTGAASSTSGPACSTKAGNNNLTDGVHLAWTVFRNIASALLVIVLLVMVISQAIGGGPFDAYTVRKMLPKIVAAVILMQLSWVLVKWAIDLSNDLGRGVAALMSAPFGGTSNLNLPNLLGTKFGDIGNVGSGFVLFGAIAAATVAGIIISIPTLALLGLYVVLAFLTAFLVLLFRKLLIILLVIMAPVALVLWVLPGTERYWKMWQDNFTKLLLMFPMIMGLIAAGRVFAYITSGSPNGLIFPPHLAIAHLGPLPVPSLASVSSFADVIIIIAAYFAPYFLLPQTYKWGGAAMGAASKGIANMTERAGKPANEYLKWRQGLSPWKQARAARKAEIERQSKLGFYERLGANTRMGSVRRARLAGVETPGHYRGVRDAINRRGRQQVEAEELKAATESLNLEMNQAANHDQLLRDVALGNEDATWTDTSGNVHRIGRRSEWERTAAIGELARVGGAGNMRAIQEAHGRAQANTTANGGREREMMKKALDANADKLLGPLKHLYYGTESEEISPGVPNPVAGRINAHSTIEGLKPAGIAAMDGVEMETLLGELDTRIRTLPAGTQKHAEALADLATLTSTYYQAATNESIRPNIGLGVSRAMKVFVDGSTPQRAAEIREPRLRDRVDATGAPVINPATGTPFRDPAPGNPVIESTAIDPVAGVTTPLGTALAGIDPTIVAALAHIHTHVDTSGNVSI